MQFVTGNPNLVTFTQRLAGQSADASGTLFATQETKDVINLAYEELWGQAKRMDMGWGVEVAYANSVANQVYYAQPTDVSGRLVTVAIDLDGNDLSDKSASATRSPTYPKPSTQNVALQGWESGSLTTEGGWYFVQTTVGATEIGIVAPPTTGGTSSIEFVYEEDLTYLSADGDKPVIPEDHHQLIAYMAAQTLRIFIGLPFDDLRQRARDLYPSFVENMMEPMTDLDYRIPNAGRSIAEYSIRTGRIVRPS
eukprot:GHVR01052742.1.p1 GENE.GHVR01052742.1~~GHVR01052742.1.p1  ORF type:complete len:252 (+),score=38.98 GHVR01052742.1:750-1505(+)